MKKANKEEARNPIPAFFSNPIIRPYLSNVRDWQGYIRFLGLPDRRENPDVLIDRLFVEPLLTHKYVSPDDNPEDWLLYAETLIDSFEECDVVMLLGDPGVGKSTLLNYIAWLLSRPVTNPLIERMGWMLPLPMVLRELPIRGIKNFNDLLSAFLNHEIALPLRRDGGKYLRQSLEAGKTLLLLDGIDEVGNRSVRENLRTAVLDGLNRYSQCRWLLSSRIVGYEEVPFEEMYQPSDMDTILSDKTVGSQHQFEETYDRKSTRDGQMSKENRIAIRFVAPFDDQRIRDFALNWYSQREAASNLAQEKASQLIQAIHADSSIYRLARIPNLLTMMALIHRIEATLPHGRALLYERITEAYLESIDKFRGIDWSPHDLIRKRGWLGRVGLEMQRQRTTRDSTQNDTLLVNLNKVQIWLEEEMRRGNNSIQSPSVSEFLQLLARRSGLFLPRGENLYAFVHLSFQEYFAAVALVHEVTRIEWVKNGTSRLGFDRELVSKWAGENIWRETFTFAFELLADQVDDDWHTDLFDCIFGHNFEQLKLSALKQSNSERYSNLGHLLARLVLNSRSGLSPEKKSQAITICVKVALRIQSIKRRKSVSFKVRFENTIFNTLLGNDPDIDTKVFYDIGAQIERIDNPKLVLDRCQTTDFNLVANLTALRDLSLQYTEISDLTPLANLTSLNSLTLSDTRITNILPLASLMSLETLALSDTQITDIAPLASLTSLTHLNLSNTQISDVTPLANLTSLTRLDLDGTQITDITPLADLTSLTRLDLEGTQITDITPLADLTSLTRLALDGTQITDITPLADLTSLTRLDLDGTQITDITPLADLTSLTWLDLDGTQITDIAPLASLASLKMLDLEDTQITDIAPLANLVSLNTLDLDSTLITNISSLANLKSLEYLYLSNTQITDLAPLVNLTSVRVLHLNNTQITDVAPLANLKSLTYLLLDNTQITDLAPLVNLTSVRVLHLNNTQITDVAPLANLKSLTYLHLDSTQITDIAPLANLPSLISFENLD